MNHKMADELKRDDRFMMAGNMCRIIETKEVSNEDLIMVIFIIVTSNVSRRSYMTIPRDTLLSLH